MFSRSQNPTFRHQILISTPGISLYHFSRTESTSLKMAAPARRIESVSTAELYDRWAEVWGTLSTNFDINFYFELLSVPCHIIYRVWNSSQESPCITFPEQKVLHSKWQLQPVESSQSVPLSCTIVGQKYGEPLVPILTSIFTSNCFRFPVISFIAFGIHVLFIKRERTANLPSNTVKI